MSSSSQRALDLRNDDGSRLTYRLPMTSIDGAKPLLGLNEDEIMALIEDGKIRWAWDLACQSEHARFVRILNRSLVCYEKPFLGQPETLDGVLELILPPSSKITGRVRGTELQRACNVSSTHIINLVEAGLLSGGDWKRGPQGSPLITRASIARFLKERTLP